MLKKISESGNLPDSESLIAQIYEVYDLEPVSKTERLKFVKNILLLDSIKITQNLLTKSMNECPDDFLWMIAMDDEFLEQVLNSVKATNDQSLQEMFVSKFVYKLSSKLFYVFFFF